MRTIRSLLAALLLVGSAACDASEKGDAAIAEDATLPALSGRVVDQADLLSGKAEAELTARSEKLEQMTRDQLVVVTTPSLAGRTIESFGLALGRSWRIGQKSLDNGVLLIFAPNDRKVRIEVGTGLEGLLTDQRAKQIIDADLVPALRQAQYDKAARDGVDAIATLLVADKRRPQRRLQKDPQ